MKPIAFIFIMQQCIVVHYVNPFAVYNTGVHIGTTTHMGDLLP